MAKRDQRRPVNLLPTGSRVRPGLRRSLVWLLHTGKLPAALLVSLAGWGIYFALTSPRYQVRNVEAVGIQALSFEDVATLAAVEGLPIWSIQTADIEARVAQSPYVERVTARLMLPDRVVVNIAERKPDVRWIHNGAAYDVTWNGLIVDARPENEVPPVPLPATEALTQTQPALEEAPVPAQEPIANSVTIHDTTQNRPLNVGDYVDADALELARRVSLRAPSELPAPITRIEWDSGLGISLIMGEGHQVVLGRSDDLDRKLATLRFLMMDGTPFNFLDLRPTTPYYR